MQNKTLDVPPFGGLFLILMILIALALPLRAPQGLMVRLPALQPCRWEEVFQITILIHVLPGGDVTVNGDGVRRGLLATRLHEVFATRNLRVVVIAADSGLPFQEVAEVIDIAETEVDYLVLLTPPVEMEWESGSCLGISTGSQVVSLLFPSPLP